MNPETKLKAITACAKASQRVAKAISEGSFEDLEDIFNDLRAELKLIQATEKVFPDGGTHSNTATEFKVSSGEYIMGMEWLLENYKKRESPEQFEARKSKTKEVLKGLLGNINDITKENTEEE